MNVTTVSLEFAKRLADASPWLDRCAETVQPRVRLSAVGLARSRTRAAISAGRSGKASARETS
jgi:hypothetical protein